MPMITTSLFWPRAVVGRDLIAWGSGVTSGERDRVELARVGIEPRQLYPRLQLCQT
jgi:hypothetical protein